MNKLPYIVAGLVLAAAAAAQDVAGPADPQGDADAAPAPSAGQTPIAAGISLEEVIVIGDRSLSSLRQEVYLAEEAFYDAYNAFNADDEFDVSCRQRAMTGSRILRRVCEAQFVKDLNAEYAQAFLRGDPLPPINPAMMFKGRQLVEDMRETAAREPQVLEALLELAAIRTRYDEEHERRCSGRIFCRRR